MIMDQSKYVLKISTMGDNTLMVVDTANDDAEDTETLTFNGTACGTNRMRN